MPGAVIGSSSGAYRSNRSSTLAPDARLALPFLADTGGSLERPPKQLTAAMLVLSCCERDSAENMPPRRVRSVGDRGRGEREERADEGPGEAVAGERGGHCEGKKEPSRGNLRRCRLEIFLKSATTEGARPRLGRVMSSHTDTQTAKIATLTFITGVALGFVLNNRLRRWLNGY